VQAASPVAVRETRGEMDSDDGPHDEIATIAFVDVGQGDCTVVMPSAETGILVDCPNQGAQDAVRALNGLGVTHLALAFITHWDADHFGGILTVASAVGCDEIRYNHDTLIADTDTPKQLRLAILLRLLSSEFNDVVLSPAVYGQSGTVGAVGWELLGPDHRTLTEAVARRNRNRGSAILSIQCANTRIIIGGDSDAVGWARVMHRGDVSADVLRSSHHGAMGEFTSYPTIEKVIEAVRPAFLVISVGSANTYGHPAERAVAAARAVGARVMCTEATGKCALINPDNGRVACAGTIVLTVGSGGVVSVTPTPSAHAKRMTSLSLTPLCMDPAAG
jgi:competence protein ComEC